MKHMFTIAGMTCNGGKTSVDDKLGNLRTTLKKTRIKATFVNNSIVIVVSIIMILITYN